MKSLFPRAQAGNSAHFDPGDHRMFAGDAVSVPDLLLPFSSEIQTFHCLH
jgi:hypothetical protein